MYIEENEMQTISCNSSSCFPKPIVKWYLRNSTVTEEITNLSRQSYISQKDGLTSAESIIHLLLNRTHDSWYLYCEVWTGLAYFDIASKEILLNVTYQPDGPPIIVGYEQDKIYQIVESESVKLNCTVTGGKPFATLKMACFNTSTTQNTVTTETTVTIQIACKAIRNHSNCTCQSDHIVGGTQKTYISFDVLFPPSNINFAILGKKSESEQLVVKKNEEVTLECIAESNPYPEIVIRNEMNENIAWKINNISVQHTIDNVSCSDAGEYSCSARNIFIFGQGVKSRLILIVKCPPRPSADNLKEGKLAVVLHSDVTLQFLAQNYFDEENNTIFTWYNQNSSLQNGGRKYIISSLGLQSTLIVRNVTQTDYGQYHVEVRNSAGFYIHYYELQTKAKQPTTDSTLIWTLISVSAGTFVSTIIAGVVAFLCCRFIRRRQHLKQSSKQTVEDIHENQPTFNPDEIDTVHEYEELDDEHRIDDRTYMEMHTIKAGDDAHRDYLTPTL
ncbi:vascular endothelial growth factor receptor 1-like [Ruditapes philippinarum]|uniref:vascular endothelial growth factor receptor 1-like n=1 Tax=Ruditapes philippinarum TaxID=129788 RepID=UPI00295ACD95|nr:vascular endothelial growth factor receptor 1-like [Ruditapes philippinarum]